MDERAIYVDVNNVKVVQPRVIDRGQISNVDVVKDENFVLVMNLIRKIYKNLYKKVEQVDVFIDYKDGI